MPVLSTTLTTGHMWLLSSFNVASATEDKKFKLYLMLIYLNLYNHIWLVAIALDSEHWNSL